MRWNIELGSVVTRCRATSSDSIALRSCHWQRHSHLITGGQKRGAFSLICKNPVRSPEADTSSQQRYLFCSTPRRNATDTDFGILLSETLSRHLAEMVLIQVGSFYEVCMFWAPVFVYAHELLQAYGAAGEQLSIALGMTLTSKRLRLAGEASSRSLPMCGFPITQLDRHLRTLVQRQGRRVAVYEQFEASPVDKTIIRRLSRIYSPGTLYEPAFVIADDNNYLMAIDCDLVTSTVALAYTDISTGELFQTHIPLTLLSAEFARIEPKELVLGEMDQQTRSFVLQSISHTATSITDVPTSGRTSPLETLRAYLQSALPDMKIQLGQPVESTVDRVRMSASTLSSLEIKHTRTGGSQTTKGSLAAVMRRTVTPGGSRLLLHRLCTC